MPRIAIFTDTHLGYANQYLRGTAGDENYLLFRECLHLAIGIQANLILHAGDLFDKRLPNAKVLKAIKVLKEYGVTGITGDGDCRFALIYGNHDNSDQPIELMEAAGVCTLLSPGTPTTFTISAVPVIFEDGVILLYGFSYTESLSSNEEVIALEEYTGSHPVLATFLILHQDYSTQMGRKCIDLNFVEEFNREATIPIDYVLIGHEHAEHVSKPSDSFQLLIPGSVHKTSRIRSLTKMKKEETNIYILDCNGYNDRSENHILKVSSLFASFHHSSTSTIHLDCSDERYLMEEGIDGLKKRIEEEIHQDVRGLIEHVCDVVYYRFRTAADHLQELWANYLDSTARPVFDLWFNWLLSPKGAIFHLPDEVPQYTGFSLAALAIEMDEISKFKELCLSLIQTASEPLPLRLDGGFTFMDIGLPKIYATCNYDVVIRRPMMAGLSQIQSIQVLDILEGLQKYYAVVQQIGRRFDEKVYFYNSHTYIETIRIIDTAIPSQPTKEGVEDDVQDVTLQDCSTTLLERLASLQRETTRYCALRLQREPSSKLGGSMIRNREGRENQEEEQQEQQEQREISCSSDALENMVLIPFFIERIKMEQRKGLETKRTSQREVENRRLTLEKDLTELLLALYQAEDWTKESIELKALIQSSDLFQSESV